MATVIDILSSDDEDEPRLPPARCQNPTSEPVCKREWDAVQNNPLPKGEIPEQGSGMNEGVSTSGQSHVPSSPSAALAQIKGKTREDIRLAEPAAPRGSLCRQFWQAGNYEAHPPKRRRVVQGAMDHVRVHPKFLHSNATSHKWALGAIAELLDNSIDEIVNGATYCRVDNIPNPRDGSQSLLVQDDGGGMSPDDIRQCMSLGYSQKNSNTTIGQYGNGFKTSTMRLGADVIVLTRKASANGLVTQSVGLLSYTFLRKTGHEDIVVPMVDYSYLGDSVKPAAFLRSNEDDWLSNLATITRWSPYRSEDELLKQFDDIGMHGTKVIVYNLWHNDDGLLELDFETHRHDIQLRVGTKEKTKQPNLTSMLVDDHISSLYRFSLRVYASILYLKMPENFRIILRGEVVEHQSIALDLKFTQFIQYKPQIGASNKDVSVFTTIGFIKEAPMVNVHGFNVYHKNRLIMPFWKIVQVNDSRGRGVVGVLEANFIEPAHDKQGFERTGVFLRLENRLKAMTMEYWSLHCHLVGYKPSSRQPKAVPRLNNPGINPTLNIAVSSFVPNPLVAQPEAQGPTSPTGSSSRHPEGTMENGPSEGRNPSSTSGPATPDAETVVSINKVTVKGELTRNSSELQAILAPDAAFGGEAGHSVVTISQESGILMAEVLEHNMTLRQRCADYEKREKHWELKLMVHEQREQEQELKVATLEKELMEYKLKCANLEQMQRLTPNTAAAPVEQVQPGAVCKSEPK